MTDATPKAPCIYFDVVKMLPYYYDAQRNRWRRWTWWHRPKWSKP